MGNLDPCFAYSGLLQPFEPGLVWKIGLEFTTIRSGYQRPPRSFRL